MIIPLQDHLFSISEDVAYLNTAYMSPLMHSVVDAMALGSSYKIEPWTYTPDQFFLCPKRPGPSPVKYLDVLPKISPSYPRQVTASKPRRISIPSKTAPQKWARAFQSYPRRMTMIGQTFYFATSTNKPPLLPFRKPIGRAAQR